MRPSTVGLDKRQRRRVLRRWGKFKQLQKHFDQVHSVAVISAAGMADIVTTLEHVKEAYHAMNDAIREKNRQVRLV